MEILQFYTPVESNRHYQHTVEKLSESLNGKCCFKVYHTADRFLQKLERNLSEYDIVLMTVHGSMESVIAPNPPHLRMEHRYRKIINKEQTSKFQNDCVIAIACFTAEEFGPEAIKNNAQTYIGFHKEIGGIIAVRNQEYNKRARYYCELISKKILTETIAECMYKFISDFQTAELFKQTFCFLLEKRLSAFFEMTAEEIFSIYGQKIPEDQWEKCKGTMGLFQLNMLRTVNSSMECLGDSNYIPIAGFDFCSSLTPSQLKRLENASFKNKDYLEQFEERFKLFQQEHEVV